MADHRNGSVVTGDAVVLDVQIAQLPVRAVGSLIDILVMFVGYLLGVALWAMTLYQFDSALSAAVLIIFTVLVLVGYPLVCEMTTRGRTLGKMAMGLRVVSDDGGPERFRQALFRALAGVIEIWGFFGAPAVICSLLSPNGKRIGDIFAGTVVINERGPKLAPPPSMPPALQWWASSLQLSGLDADHAELARQFLARAPQLQPQLRDQMAARIADQVAVRISPPPPPGTPPQYMLAAVLAERHRRELSRLRLAGSQAAWPPHYVVHPGVQQQPWPAAQQWPPQQQQQPPDPHWARQHWQPAPVPPAAAPQPQAPSADGFTPPS